jgi:hypothetical protein
VDPGCAGRHRHPVISTPSRLLVDVGSGAERRTIDYAPQSEQPAGNETDNRGRIVQSLAEDDLSAGGVKTENRSRAGIAPRTEPSGSEMNRKCRPGGWTPSAQPRHDSHPSTPRWARR